MYTVRERILKARFSSQVGDRTWREFEQGSDAALLSILLRSEGRFCTAVVGECAFMNGARCKFW